MFRVPLKLLSVVGAVALTVAVLPAASASAVLGGTAVVSAAAPGVTQAHPRLLLTKTDVQSLKDSLATDVTASAFYAPVKQRADELLNVGTLQYSTATGDLQPVSRELLNRVYSLGIAWRVTGDLKYADRLWRDLEAASKFKDWNPAHFLDTAEMAQAFAISYDWMHGYLSDYKKSVMKTAIETRAFQPAISAYNGNAHWTKTVGNWNVVVNSALGTAALSFDDLTPALSRDVLTRALANIKVGIGAYGDDGSFSEGITYWGYATSYLATFASSLETSTGSRQGILDRPGIAKSGQFVMRMTGPSGHISNFGDAWSNEGVTAPLLALEALTKDGNLRGRAIPGLSGPDAVSMGPLSLIWYNEARAVSATKSSMTLDAAYSGFPVATMRGSWGDRMATGVSLKGGTAGDRGHEDLDAGTFTLDALGERWAVDLGADSYKLPGYFGLDTGQRWDYYRKRAEGHNRLVVNPGRGPDSVVGARASVTMMRSQPNEGSAVTDLSATYSGGPITSWRRGVSLFDGRSQVLVQDEVRVSGTADVWWFMHTGADIALSGDGRTATLRIRDKALDVQLLEPTAGKFVVMPAAPLWTSPAPSGQERNAGVNKLAIQLTQSTSTRIAVQFSPRTGATPAARTSVRPLGDWSAPPPAAAALSEIKVAGVPLVDFEARKLTYNVEASSVDAPPQVAASAPAGSTVSVRQATSTPGRAEVRVSAPGKTDSVYYVVFRAGAVTVTNVSTSTGDARLARDRLPYTYWSVQGTQSMLFDLGERRTVQHAEIDWRGRPNEYATFKIEVSDNKTTWRQVFEGSVRSHSETQWSSWTTGALKSRYVRLTVFGAGATKESSINEISLYSEANYIRSYPKTERWRATATSPSVTLDMGKSASFAYSAQRPSGYAGPEPGREFFTTDSRIATIDSAGRVTAVGAGVANVGVRLRLAEELVFAVMRVEVKNPDVIALTAVKDGYVQGGESWNNYTFRNAQELYVRHNAQYPAFDRVTYLGFDLSGIPLDRVTSATLTADMRPRADSTVKSHATAFTVDGSWSEANLTFANRPKLVDRLGSVGVTGGFAQRAIDVTDAVRAAGGRTDLTLGLSQDASGVGAAVELSVKSRRTITPPTLTIRLSDAVPKAPTIQSAVSSTPTTPGTVGISAIGVAGTTGTVDLWESAVDRCPSSRGAASFLSSEPVTFGSSGTAEAEMRTAIKPGSWLFATTRASEDRISSLSECVQPKLGEGVGEERAYLPVQSGHVEGRSSADTVYDRSSTMLVKHSQRYPEFDRYGFAQFDLANLSGQSIEKASLVFRAVSPSAATHITTYDITRNWDQKTLTFNNRPEFGERVARADVRTSWSDVEIDVTDWARRHAGESGSVGISQDDPGGDAIVSIDGHRSASPPQLKVVLRPYDALSSPEISAAYAATTTSDGLVEGTVGGAPPGANVVVEFFSASNCVSHRGAARPIGEVEVTADQDGQAKFRLETPVRKGESVVASAAAAGPRSSDLSQCAEVVPRPGVSEEVVFNATADTFVHGGSWADTAFPTAKELQAKSTTAYPSFDRNALLGFDTRSLAGRTVESAVLEVNARSSSVPSHVTARAIAEPWNPMNVTFNSRPALGERLSSAPVEVVAGRVKIDVTSYFLRAADSQHGLALVQDGEGIGAGDVVLIDGSRTGHGPTLTVMLTPAG